MITDGYVIFSLVVIMAMIVSGIMSVQQSAAGCSTSGCLTARGLLPWLVLTLVVVVGVSVSRTGRSVASAARSAAGRPGAAQPTAQPAAVGRDRSRAIGVVLVVRSPW